MTNSVQHFFNYLKCYMRARMANNIDIDEKNNRDIMNSRLIKRGKGKGKGKRMECHDWNHQ